MLMSFAVWLCYLSSSERKAWKIVQAFLSFATHLTFYRCFEIKTGSNYHPKKVSKLTFWALALPNLLWQNANAQNTSVAIYYGGNLSLINSFDATFSWFSSPPKRQLCLFRNLTILWLGYAVQFPVGGLNPWSRLWSTMPWNFSECSVTHPPERLSHWDTSCS